MKILVTGAAGFIGSHLCEALTKVGIEVVGLDNFLDYYPRALKEANLASLKGEQRFTFQEGDLLSVDLKTLLLGVEAVFHLAAQAGVRASWGGDFQTYTQNNILATQRLLEISKGLPIKQFIYASSSSVYGDGADLPMREEALPRPHSPYGVSKLAGEHLCGLYARNFGVPVIALRFFTVYGPRQRPDMAFHRFIRSSFLGDPVTLYGGGEQTRDFTYISDILEALVKALKGPTNGEVVNVGGGHRVKVKEVIRLLAELTGSPPRIEHQPLPPGDVRDTYADLAKARSLLGYQPVYSLEEGLKAEIDWFKAVVMKL